MRPSLPRFAGWSVSVIAKLLKRAKPVPLWGISEAFNLNLVSPAPKAY
jgi:hypothetical protein